MPFIHLSVSKELSANISKKISLQLLEITESVLRKKPAVTEIVIKVSVGSDSWFVGR